MTTQGSGLAKTASEGAAHHLCYLSDDEIAVNPLDMTLQCMIAKFTGGISPSSMIMAWLDWSLHFSLSPGKQIALANRLQQQASAWPALLAGAANDPSQTSPTHQLPQVHESDEGHLHLPPPINDKRFIHPGWSNWPFNAISQAFLNSEQYWQEATTGVRGVSSHHEHVVNFTARQLLDVVSPSNFPWLNPEVIVTTTNSGGKNILAGMTHWLNDMGLKVAIPGDDQAAHVQEHTQFRAGHEVAITPGKIVFRNDLIELIQYSPLTAKTFAEPILIVPSWIMKYYILDLSPHNSMVRFLVEQGHTVFMISWKNPVKEDRDLGMHDYLESGLFTALGKVASVTPKQSSACGRILSGRHLTQYRCGCN